MTKPKEKRIAIMTEKITGGNFWYAIVRWSPDGSNFPGQVCVQSRTSSTAGINIQIPVDEARQLVEILHEAITAVSAQGAE